MSDEDLLRPRWGLFSVVDHLDPGGLVPDILLYDRLVFPTPTPEDRARWVGRGWDPELQAARLRELGDLAEGAPWTADLRSAWQHHWDEAKQRGIEREELAYAITPMVLAASALKDQAIPPIPVAAFQNPAVARSVYGVVEREAGGDPAREELHREVGFLFERKLQLPVVDDPRATYGKAIELAHRPDFQRARRALYEWEDRCALQGWPTQSAIRQLEQRVAEHEDLIREAFRKTWTVRAFRVVKTVAPVVVEAVTTATTGVPVVAGLGTTGLIRLVSARFPALVQPPDSPLDRPEAALHLALSAVSRE